MDAILAGHFTFADLSILTAASNGVSRLTVANVAQDLAAGSFYLCARTEASQCSAQEARMVSGSRWMAFAGVSLMLIAGITGVAWSGRGSGGARRTNAGKEIGGAGKTTKGSAKEVTQRIDLSAAM